MFLTKEEYSKKYNLTEEQATLWCGFLEDQEQRLHELRKCPNCGQHTLEYENDDWELVIPAYLYCSNEETYCDFRNEDVNKYRDLSSGFVHDYISMMYYVSNEATNNEKFMLDGLSWGEFVDKVIRESVGV